MHFFKKIKKKTRRYHYQNLNDMIYSSWDIEQNILKLVILGHFLPFYPPKNPKNQNFEKWKNLLEISSFTHVYQISQSYDVQFLRYWVRITNFFVILSHFFTLLPPPPSLIIPKIKILKKKKRNEKNALRYYPFIHKCVP